jgi:ABC-type uncharacterized transport system permease subunit
VTEPHSQAPLGADPEGYAPTVARRMAFYQRAGGIVTPVMTAVFAFLMGGVVVLATGHNPWRTYKAIFEGSGLNWFFHVGNHSIHLPFSDTHVWFLWDTNTNHTAAYNLTQTLLTTTPLILTGLAVAFAFRCGLFNIGGQGQYLMGTIVGVYIGSRFTDMGHLPHVLFALTCAALAGALWGAIAGFLKATVGAHEVITTIMLNWIALWIASYLVGFGGPMQDPRQISAPVTRQVAESAHLKVFWGNALLQGLHVGIVIAILALFVYWIVLNRTTLGYEVKAVGFNPEAARYGGISVARNYFLAMAISGAFAGLAGSIDILGWEFNLDLTEVQSDQIGFIGIAVALLGRNTAVGVFLSAILFGALLTGTSTRNLDPTIFQPELAGNLTRIIQGLVVLFVGADLIILYLWQARRKLPFARKADQP